MLSLPEDEYDEIEIIDPYLLREFDGDKLSIIDVKLHTKNKKTLHIEIQLRVTPELRNRIVFYDSKLITEQIGNGDNYDAIQNVISIVIMNENLITTNTRYHHRFTLYDPEAGVELTDLLEVHTLELEKLPDIPDGSQLYDWAKFIDAEREEELKVLEERNPEIGKAVVKFRELSADERVRDTFFRQEMMRRDIAALNKQARQEGREEGRQEGRQEGEREKALAIAKSLLGMGLTVDKIAASTGLDRKTIETLKS